MDDKIPSFPVIHVTVRLDGSAHVNVTGQHVDYPPADPDVTRAEVTTFAVDFAARLGRAVRMTTVDPDGEWKLGVYPDGAVIDLAPAPAKGRATKAGSPRPRPAAVAVSEPPALPKDSTTVVIERTTERAVIPRVPRQARPPAGTPVATLKFSTGDSAIIGPPAVIGRNPSARVVDAAGAQLVTVTDPSRTVSRVHADVSWAASSPSATAAPATARRSRASQDPGSNSHPASPTSCTTATCCTSGPKSHARLPSPTCRTERHDDPPPQPHGNRSG